MSAAKMTMAAALNQALHHAMAADDQIICIGEDIVGGAGMEGASPGGGVFGVTRGLAETYGLNRVIDTPISETAFVGMAVGSAMTGQRPVVEIMFNDFIGVCFDQILNQAAKARFLSNGRMDLPLVIRTTMGAGDGSGAMHSASLHGLLASVAGLTVVCPSTPADAAGMLKTALKSSGPTVMMEHKQLYGRLGDVDLTLPDVPFGKARTVVEGSDITIVAAAAMAIEVELAAGLLAQGSVSVEVIDPRTIKPLDVASIVESVRKTGRLLVVDEGAAFAGFADAVISAVAERAYASLKNAPKKLCPPDTPVPYAPDAESIWLPASADIVKAAQDMMEV